MHVNGRPLRLLLVANRHEHNDGQGRVNYEVALAALNSGIRVTLLSAHCAEDLAQHPNATFIRIGKEGLPTQLLKNLAFANESAAWIRKHRDEFDVIQANGFITWESCDIVTAHFVHTSWLDSNHFPYRKTVRPAALYQRVFTALNARWERVAFQRATRVIAVSEIVAQDVQRLGVAQNRIEVIYNGVDTVEFAPGAGERASFGLPGGVPMALFVGDIRVPRKNVHTVLRAIQRLPHVHLAVAGDTGRSFAPSLANDLQIGDRVHFLGKTPRIPELMRSVDLFIFPSLYEPFGLVALEAAASGLPAVLSAHVGCAAALRGAFPILKDPENPAELAAVIESLLRSPEHRRAIGNQARQRALSLKWSDCALRYLQIYTSVASKPLHLAVPPEHDLRLVN